MPLYCYKCGAAVTAQVCDSCGTAVPVEAAIDGSGPAAEPQRGDTAERRGRRGSVVVPITTASSARAARAAGVVSAGGIAPVPGAAVPVEQVDAETDSLVSEQSLAPDEQTAELAVPQREDTAADHDNAATPAEVVEPAAPQQWEPDPAAPGPVVASALDTGGQWSPDTPQVAEPPAAPTVRYPIWCPSCSQTQLAKGGTCSRCGFVDGTRIDAETHAQQQTTLGDDSLAIPAKTTRQCSRCGHIRSVGSTECAKCGWEGWSVVPLRTRLYSTVAKQEKKTYTCRRCFKKSTFTEGICGRCGLPWQ